MLFAQEMNLADLTSLIVVITGFAGGAIASASVGAPWWVSVLCGVIGLAVGFLMAWPISKAAYKLLGLDSAIGFIGYMILPLVAIIGAGGTIIAGTILVLNWISYSEAVRSSADTIKTKRQSKTLVARANSTTSSLRSGPLDSALPQL